MRNRSSIVLPLLLGAGLVLFSMNSGDPSASPERFGHRLHALLAPAWWFLVIGCAMSWSLVFAALLYRWGCFPRMLHWLVPRAVLRQLTGEETFESPWVHDDPPAQEPVVLDAISLERALSLQVPGQQTLCRDLARHLRGRLAMQRREEPVGVYLLAGRDDAARAGLVRQLAKELQRPLLQFDPRTLAAKSTNLIDALAAGLRRHPDAVVLIEPLEAMPPVAVIELVRGSRQGTLPVSGSPQAAVNGAIFVLATALPVEPASGAAVESAPPVPLQAAESLRRNGVADELLQRVDRLLVLPPLHQADQAGRCIRELSAMIERYGMKAVDRGIDPVAIAALLAHYRNDDEPTAVQRLVASFESSTADSLIKARQAGCQRIELRTDNGRLRVRASREAVQA